jgi:hypothetical protein
LNRIAPKGKKGEDFGSYWERTESQERSREALDERVDS